MYFGGSDSYTVTYSTMDTVTSVSCYNVGATFALAGGSLQTTNWLMDGAYTQGAGDLILLQGGQFYGPLTQTGGAIVVDTGALIAAGSLDAFGGTIAGTGTLDIAGTGATLEAGAALDISNITLGYGDVLSLATGLGTETYEGDFIAASGSSLNSNGQNLVLGPDSSGTFGATFGGGGSLEIKGLVDVGGAVLTGSGTQLIVSGTALQDQSPLTLGTLAGDTDTLSIIAGGTYNFAGEGSITGNTASSLIIAAGGTLAVTAPSNSVFVEVASLTQTGLIIADGTLAITGGASNPAQASLNGSIIGTGEFEIGAYETASLGGIALGEGTIDTAGHVFTLAAASTGTLANIVNGGGTVRIAGSLELDAPTLTGSGTELLITGTAFQTDAYVALGTTAGDHTTFAVAAGGTYNIATEFALRGTGTAVVTNAGLIEVMGDNPDTGPILNKIDFTNMGSIDIEIGTLALENGTATIGGTVGGLGALELGGFSIPETATLAAGAQLDVASLALYGGILDLAASNSYFGMLLDGGGLETINLGGNNLTVANGTLQALIEGGGSLVAQNMLSPRRHDLKRRQRTGGLWHPRRRQFGSARRLQRRCRDAEHRRRRGLRCRKLQ